MTTEGQQSTKGDSAEPVLLRGGLVHDVAMIAGGAVANGMVRPLVDIGVEKLQDRLHHDPKPEVELPPGYDHGRDGE